MFLKSFFQANKRLCSRIARQTDVGKTDILGLYISTVIQQLRRPNQLVLDVGGSRCLFHRGRSDGCRLVAVDVSPAELEKNRDVDETRVADVNREIPFPNDSVDMVTSCFLVEHLSSVEAFLEHSQRVLRPGGLFIAVFPSRFSPFALLNQAIPLAVSRRLLYFFQSDAPGLAGFPTRYDRCYPSAFEGLLRKAGFDVVETCYSYFQSHYYDFFLPAFMLSLAYDSLIARLGVRDLCAHELVVARKTSTLSA